ncbi:beta-N-acetylhexosaminidase [Acidithiobacillus sp. M4-SHS-6]|uniref:beta-N-acetylhexosaminidase n=1 Tax=Acidithiobacillus sp. M4-SHS-6 TaxID=3383024 RepID=UPI0039BDCD19
MLGPLMVDIASLQPTPEERRMLCEPAVGGVILFARNCQDAQQVRALCQEIHTLRSPPLLIGIDQEGGRVQRLKAGVTRFPPMARLGQYAEQQGLQAAEGVAYDWGRLLGAELRALDVDFSFTPCLDLDRGISQVIGDRAIHRNPEWVAAIAVRLWQGMADSGLQGVGKHFPGHGAVAADSHHALPRDDRPRMAMEADLFPFRRLIQAGIPAIMPAHCLYAQIDPEQPAGFSSIWLQDVLRREMGFNGVIISDDLSMGGAQVAGEMPARVDAARQAGADLLLVCNDPEGAHTAIAHLQNQGMASGAGTLASLAGTAGTPLLASERARCIREIAEISP